MLNIFFIVISGYAINVFSSYLSFKGNKIIIKNDTFELTVKPLRKSQQKIKKPWFKSKDAEGVRYLSCNLSIHFLVSYYWGTGGK